MATRARAATPKAKAKARSKRTVRRSRRTRRETGLPAGSKLRKIVDSNPEAEKDWFEMVMDDPRGITKAAAISRWKYKWDEEYCEYTKRRKRIENGLKAVDKLFGEDVELKLLKQVAIEHDLDTPQRVRRLRRDKLEDLIRDGIRADNDEFKAADVRKILKPRAVAEAAREAAKPKPRTQTATAKPVRRARVPGRKPNDEPPKVVVPKVRIKPRWKK